MVCDWQKIIDQLKWSENDLEQTSTPYVESKSKCKWAKSESNQIDLTSQLNTHWKQISTLVRPKKVDRPLEIIAYKYRIYPTTKQKQRLRKAFGTLRFLRNKGIDLVNHWSTLDDQSKIQELKDLQIKLKEDYKPTVLPPASYIRKHLINTDAKILLTHPWLSKYLCDFKDLAREQLFDDYKTAFARKKVDGRPFRMNKRFKRPLTESFRIPSKYWYKGKWKKYLPEDKSCKDKRAKNYLENPSFRIEELMNEGYLPREVDKLPDQIKHAARILRHKKEYYVIINLPFTEEKQSKEGLLAIDPGYRTLFTCINFRDNRLEEIGMKNIIHPKTGKRVNKIDLEVDKAEKFQGLASKTKNKRKRRHMKRRQHKSLNKIKNLVKDLHESTAKYLCENYSTILVPKLNFHKLTGLNKSIKTYAQKVSHCSFVDRLKTKAKQYSNCKVIQVTEECTSKTCSMCGSYYDVKSSKTYDCPSCGAKMDRDLNAVYNILMKHIASKTKRKLF